MYLIGVWPRAMYVKITSRKTQHGRVRYLHLAHNEWDPVARRSVPKILHGLGREDQIDRAAIKRLVGSLARLLEPDDRPAPAGAAGLRFVESRPYGGAYVLDQLWQRLEIPQLVGGLGQRGRGRCVDSALIERALFALVAHRALAAASPQLTATDWVSREVRIDGLTDLTDDMRGLTMDWLGNVGGWLQAEVSDRACALLNPRVGLPFLDATTTCGLAAQLKHLIAGPARLPAPKSGELDRFSRFTPGGPPRADAEKSEAAGELDGQCLPCSDLRLPAEDLAPGYEWVLDAIRDWQNIGGHPEHRPAGDGLGQRIPPDVALRWMAVLLIRIVETNAADTWVNIRSDLDRLHAGTFTGPAGTFRQCTELSNSQRDVLAKLRIAPPRQIVELQTT